MRYDQYNLPTHTLSLMSNIVKSWDQVPSTAVTGSSVSLDITRAKARHPIAIGTTCKLTMTRGIHAWGKCDLLLYIRLHLEWTMLGPSYSTCDTQTTCMLGVGRDKPAACWEVQKANLRTCKVHIVISSQNESSSLQYTGSILQVPPLLILQIPTLEQETLHSIPSLQVGLANVMS